MSSEVLGFAAPLLPSTAKCRSSMRPLVGVVDSSQMTRRLSQPVAMLAGSGRADTSGGPKQGPNIQVTPSSDSSSTSWLYSFDCLATGERYRHSPGDNGGAERDQVRDGAILLEGTRDFPVPDTCSRPKIGVGNKQSPYSTSRALLRDLRSKPERFITKLKSIQ